MPWGGYLVKALMLGMIAVGLVVGIAVGRVSERSRRSYKDFVTAKGALAKGRKTMLGEVRKAAVTILLVGVAMAIVFFGAMNWPH